MLCLNIQIKQVARCQRCAVFHNHFDLIDLVVRPIQAKLRGGLRDRSAFFGLLEIIIPEVIARQVIIAIAVHLIELGRQIARLVRFIQTNLAGVHVGIVLKLRAGADIVPPVVHDNESFVRVNGRRENAAIIGITHVFSCLYFIRNELSVVIQTYNEVIGARRGNQTSVLDMRSRAHIAGLFIIEIDFNFMFDALIHLFFEGSGQNVS